MISFLVEALFALVFALAFAEYVKSRDPVQRDVMAVFSAVAMLFVLDVARTLFGSPPAALRATALILLFAQPYLTVRLVHRVRPVPRWLHVAAVLAALLSVVPVLTSPKLSVLALAMILTGYLGVQTVAAVLLAREARGRTGSPRARLGVAAASTEAFGLALLSASIGAVVPAGRDTGRTVGYIFALLSACGYIVAFRSPAWVRRLWSGTASYRVSRELLEAPTSDSPDQTWTRYAHTVRDVSGADAVLVLPPGAGDRLVATAGLGEEEVHASDGDARRLLGMPGVVSVHARAADLPAFVVGYAGEVGARFLTATALRSSVGGSTGALVLLNRRRGLFAEDDVRLLAELGAQAAIVAERGAVRDEQERLAHELARSVRALSAASQAKSDFLASMSHELRTPLNAIIGFSELMRGEEGVEDSRVVPVEWIEHIYASGRHLLNLINDILDLAKIEAGRLELRPERVELSGLVADIVSTLRPLMERKGLTLRTEVPALDVHVDRVRLRQVLDNLLSNAIKFTPEGGSITVQARRDDAEVRMSVIDTGVGIAAADQERIFDEFQQVGDASMHQAGTGLGLALTKRLVESHHGRIELDSEIGQGSRFVVCLPDVFAAEASAALPGGGPVAAGAEPASGPGTGWAAPVDGLPTETGPALTGPALTGPALTGPASSGPVSSGSVPAGWTSDRVSARAGSPAGAGHAGPNGGSQPRAGVGGAPAAPSHDGAAGNGARRPGPAADAGPNGVTADVAGPGAAPEAAATGAMPGSGPTGATPRLGATGAMPGSGPTGATSGSGPTGLPGSDAAATTGSVPVTPTTAEAGQSGLADADQAAGGPGDSPVAGPPGTPADEPAGSAPGRTYAGRRRYDPGEASIVEEADAKAAAAAAAAAGAVDAAVAASGTELLVAAAISGTRDLPPQEKGGILLIEDEPSAARLLRMYLETAGYRVRLATTGEDGLRAARQERPDAVVLDVLLPGIDGWEVLRLLKQDPELSRVPVFVASVVDERDVGLSLGAVDFFVKPIDRQRMLSRVAEFLLKPGTGVERMHVLAVDDDPETLAVITDALREQEVDVVTADTAEEAVRLARTQPFDLIISDLLMPDMDGITLIGELDHDPATSKIPVLMVTGHDLGEPGPARETKALGILPKGEAIHEALHHWMTRLPRRAGTGDEPDRTDGAAATNNSTGPEATS